MDNSIARFQISADEDFRIQFAFVGLSLAGRTLRILVKERASNIVRDTLTLGSGLTLDGADTVTALVSQATASAWAKGEFETDLHDITGGTNTRLVGARTLYDLPGRLPHGVIGAKATVQWVVNKAIVTAIGGIGPSGPVGPAGPANSLAIGTVTTGAPGSSATATITGDAPSQTLNLTIPRGNTGSTGAAATVAVGTTTTGAAGSSASVTNSGTSAAAVFNFTVPRGNTGSAATIAVGTVTTVANGTPAAVTNSGTSGSAVFDFTIPAGPAGSVTDGDKGDITVSSGGTAWAIDAAYTAQWMPKAGGTFTGDVTLQKSVPILSIWDTSAGADLKRIRTTTSGGVTNFQLLTDAGANKAVPISISHTAGLVTFALRPMFGANTPWDSGNFTPSSYAPLAGGTFTGLVRISAGSVVGTSYDTLILSSGSLTSTIGNGSKLVLTSQGPTGGSTRGVILEGVNTTGGSNGHDFVLSTSAASSLPAERLRVTSAGILQTQVRPSFAGNTPWDSGNLDAFTGDSGSGGGKGLVPAPAAGDATKFLRGDGTWQAVNLALPIGYFNGLSMANDTTDATNDIVVKPGSCRDSGDARNLVLTVNCIKQIDVAFAEYSSPGTPSGGRSSSDTLTGSKWFHVFMIGGAGKNSQPFFSTSLSPILPSGFTEWRRIGSIWWTGSNIKAFIQHGRRFYLTNPNSLDIDTTTLGTTAALFTVTTPLGLKCLALLQAAPSHASSFTGVYISDPDAIDLLPSITAAPLASVGQGTGNVMAAEVAVVTNTSSQIRARATNSSTTLRAYAKGWIDEV